MVWFCITDARARGRPLPWSIYWLILLTWPLFVPIYLFKTRGFKRLHRVLLGILAYIALPWLTYGITLALL